MRRVVKHLYRVRRSDFVLAMVALLAVLTFETLEALLIAVIVSLFALVLRTSLPRLAVLASPRTAWNGAISTGIPKIKPCQVS